MTSHPSRLSTQVLHNAATLVGALLAYYFFPITGESSALWQVLLFSAGLGLLVWWIIRELRKQLSAGSNPRVGVHSLITLLYRSSRCSRWPTTSLRGTIPPSSTAWSPAPSRSTSRSSPWAPSVTATCTPSA